MLSKFIELKEKFGLFLDEIDKHKLRMDEFETTYIKILKELREMEETLSATYKDMEKELRETEEKLSATYEEVQRKDEEARARTEELFANMKVLFALYNIT